MTLSRAVCELDAKVVSTILKTHVSSLEDQAYASSDMEVVVAKYEGLLVSLAALTDRVTRSVLTAGSKEIFSAAPTEHRMFGQQIAAAFAYCRQKWKGSTSGARLTDPVRTVTRVWTKQAGRSPEAKQASQNDSSASASPAATPPPKLRKIDIYRQYGLEIPKAPPAQSGSMEIVSSQEVLTQSPVSSPPRPGRTSTSSVSWLDMNRLVMVRIAAGGMQEESPLVASPGGFATASFGDDEMKTEVPNLLMKAPLVQGVFKMPAGVSAVSTDAHSVGEEEEAEGSGEEAGKGPEPRERVQGEGRARKYSKMFYKNTASFGIRQCFGAKRQVACVSGKRLGLDKDALEKVADEAISKLESGSVTEGAIKQWIRHALSEVSS